MIVLDLFPKKVLERKKCVYKESFQVVLVGIGCGCPDENRWTKTNMLL